MRRLLTSLTATLLGLVIAVPTATAGHDGSKEYQKRLKEQLKKGQPRLQLVGFYPTPGYLPPQGPVYTPAPSYYPSQGAVYPPTPGYYPPQGPASLPVPGYGAPAV